jgi:hypothetical protein
VGLGPFGEPINQPKHWATGLDKTDILGMLDIPHFGRGWDIRNYVKQMMEVTHIGYLWLEQLISIDMDLIAYITGLPTRGETPVPFLDENTKEKALAEKMKKTYRIERGSHGIIIKRISDVEKRMATKIMV